ncbi:MAG: enoyl-CoA hydratase/isomerase family protein [Proteobacteria bacterium]|nr:enoyl-CoA hydratase/isomerase family protein [Pseudomonadota bacterium]
MAYRKIKLDVSDAIATVSLSDPATLNAAALDMVEELIEAFQGLAEDDAVRAVILTGEGRGFCSGANLNDPRTTALTDGRVPDLGLALESHYRPFIEGLRNSPVPVIAAVNGPCAGIGMAFALACDLIVAGEGARFILAFRRIGLVPDGGLTWLLPRIVGKARALEMMLLGEDVPARTALDWGMVNRVVPETELMEASRALAGKLATGPRSLGLMRTLMWEALDQPLDAQLESERRAQSEAGRTGDFLEGVTAFQQKRAPRFTGR